jgi:hypothetical protein
VEQRIIWVDVSQAPYRQERVHWGCFLVSPPPAEAAAVDAALEAAYPAEPRIVWQDLPAAPMLPVARCTVCGEPEFCDCAPF